MAVLTPTFTNNINIIPDLASPDFILGYDMRITTNSQFTLSSGGARSYNNQFEVTYPSNAPFQQTSITVDKSVLGANGCWPIDIITAAAGVNTLFGVYVQGVQSGIVSAGDTSPSSARTVGTIVTGNNFLLPNFSAWRRVASVYYDAIGDVLLPMVQTGHHNLRNYMLQDAVALVTGGNAVIYTAIQLNALGLPIDPAVVTTVTLKVGFTPAAPGNTVSFSPFSSGVSAPVAVDGNDMVTMPIAFDVNGNPVIYYFVTAGGDSANISLAGWTEDYGVNAV